MRSSQRLPLRISNPFAQLIGIDPVNDRQPRYREGVRRFLGNQISLE